MNHEAAKKLVTMSPQAQANEWAQRTFRAFGLQTPEPTNLKAFAEDIISRNAVAHDVGEYFNGLLRQAGEDGALPRMVGAVGLCRSDDPNGAPTMLMERVPGISLKVAVEGIFMPKIDQNFVQLGLVTPEQFANLACQDTILHITDTILGGKDRNNENVLLSCEHGSCRVVGIDNDICLPVRETADDARPFDRLVTTKLTTLDPAQRDAILAIRREDLATIMGQNGRDVTKEPYKTEMDLMWGRVEGLQQTAKNITDGNGLLPKNDSSSWGSYLKMPACGQTKESVHLAGRPGGIGIGTNYLATHFTHAQPGDDGIYRSGLEKVYPYLQKAAPTLMKAVKKKSAEELAKNQ
jgi:hypothetical protein